ATSTCQSAYPKLREEFAALLKRFETGPISVNYTSTDHNTEAVKLSRGALITTVRSLLQSTATIAQLPQLIHESYQEKYTGLIKSVLTIRDGFWSGVGIGVFLAVIRSEDLPFTKGNEGQRLARGTFMGDY